MYNPGDSNVNSLHNSLQDLDKMTLLLRENLIQSQHRIKQISDAKHTDREFKVDDLVFLVLQPFRQPSIDLRGNRKLAPNTMDIFQFKPVSDRWPTNYSCQ